MEGNLHKIKNKTMSNYKKILGYAREMRKNPTPAEKLMWSSLRSRKFHNKKFNRQFIIKHGGFITSEHYFIADFHCHEHKLIIEIDGDIHLEQVEYDKIREEILIELGYKIVRFKNEEVLTNISAVFNKLREIFGLPKFIVTKNTKSTHYIKYV